MDTIWKFRSQWCRSLEPAKYSQREKAPASGDWPLECARLRPFLRGKLQLCGAAQQSNPIHQIQVWLRKPVVINLGWEVIDFDFQVYTLSFLNSFYNLLYNSLYSQVFVLCRALVKKFLSEQKCKALQVKSMYRIFQ